MSTSSRGYGADHQRERRRWQPIINAGNGWCQAKTCLKQSRWIEPGTPWDLGHTEDRTAWTGPEHELCNRSDGGRRWAAKRKPRRRNPRPHPGGGPPERTGG